MLKKNKKIASSVCRDCLIRWSHREYCCVIIHARLHPRAKSNYRRLWIITWLPFLARQFEMHSGVSRRNRLNLTESWRPLNVLYRCTPMYCAKGMAAKILWDLCKIQYFLVRPLKAKYTIIWFLKQFYCFYSYTNVYKKLMRESFVSKCGSFLRYRWQENWVVISTPRE